MHVFVFRPFCTLSEPHLDCSDGWAMYQYIGLMVAVGFRHFGVSAVVLGLLLVAYYAFAFGLPGFELTLNFVIGTIYGAEIVYLTRPPRLVAENPLKDYTGTLSYLLIIALGITSFAAIDTRIDENNERYGVVGAFVLVIFWTLLTKFILFQLNHMTKETKVVQQRYWDMWHQVLISLLIVMTIALIGAFGGFFKAFIAACLVIPAIYVYN